MRKATFVGKVKLKIKIKKMKEILWGDSGCVDKCFCNFIGKIKASKIILLWEYGNVS